MCYLETYSEISFKKGEKLSIMHVSDSTSFHSCDKAIIPWACFTQEKLVRKVHLHLRGRFPSPAGGSMV